MRSFFKTIPAPALTLCLALVGTIPTATPAAASWWNPFSWWSTPTPISSTHILPATNAKATMARSPSTTTQSGAPVYYFANRTVIGNDQDTITMATRVKSQRGYHDVVIHGIEYDNQGAVFIAQHTPTHTAQIAEAIRRNPNWHRGTSIRLLSCFAACGSLSPAQELANELNVNVKAATGRVTLDEAPADTPYVLDNGEWQIFTPK